MPLPAIHIHLAPDNDLLPSDLTTPQDQPTSTLFDLNSPTEQLSFDTLQDSFRPNHLLPPPSTSPRLMHHRSTQSPADKKGIDDSKFQQLLRSSRERATVMFANKKEPLELRKQVTLKAHKSKALERRALFLSKIEQLPSVAAAKTPVTPPESPAIFHFSLPSPGLQSPLALFESLSLQNKNEQPSLQQKRETWIEQVDFKSRMRQDLGSDVELDGDAGMIIENVANASLEDDLFIVHPEPSRPMSRPAAPPLSQSYDAKRDFTRQPNINIRARRAATIPSLDQITARLASTRIAHAAPVPALVADNETDSDISSDDSNSNPASPTKARGRSPSPPAISISRPTSPSRAPRAPIPLPAFLNVKRRSTEPPMTTLVVPTKISIPTVCITPPPTESSFSPVEASPSPTRSLSKRRLSSPASPVAPVVLPFRDPAPANLTPDSAFAPASTTTAEARTQTGRAMVERLRRRSSPPALPLRRDAVEHPVLSFKGGF